MDGRAWFVAAALLVVHASAWAAAGQVERWGEAEIQNGDQVAAKKAATADALRKCVEYVVGVTVKSGMTDEQQETVKNNQHDFEARVHDSVVTNSQGFVQKYDVVAQKIAGDVMKVQVRALVYESKIQAQVKKLADLIAAAGNPKLMLVIQDVYIDPAGHERVADQSVLAAALQKKLLARGFELRGAARAERVAGQSVQAYDNWLADPTRVAKMARRQGADIVIAGRVEIHDLGKIVDDAGLAALKGQTRVEITSVIHGIIAATGEVFSAKPVQMSSIGINEERAVYRAFAGRGANLVHQTFDNLFADLKTSFKKAAAQGQSYEVALNGVKSFRRQGRSFLSLLQKVAGVQTVTQRSFASGRLTLDVSCKCSSTELQNRIFNAVGSAPSLSSLDIEQVAGKRLSFKL